MSGTAKNYDITKIHQGPGDLWVIGGGVTDSAIPQLTIATDGTPDSTAHPASIHLGSFEDALTLDVKTKVTPVTIDQSDGPVDRYLETVEMMLSVSLKQIDPTILQNAAPMGTFATASGYTQLTFGGAPAQFPSACIAAIVPKRGVAGKFWVAILFKAQGTIGFQAAFGRTKASSYKAQFEGLSDLTRTAGRQIGVYYETK